MLRKFANRFNNLNNQKLGLAIGVIVGLIISIIGLFFLNIDPASGNITALGSLQNFPYWFHILFTIPFVSGLCANMFAHLGAAIDVFTNDKTLFHLVSAKGKRINTSKQNFKVGTKLLDSGKL